MTLMSSPLLAHAHTQRAQVIQPLNGDPFVGMLETPVTSAPIVANYLSNLPAYRTGVAPNLRGVEIGLAHGFLLAGPFIKVRASADTERLSSHLLMCAHNNDCSGRAEWGTTVVVSVMMRDV
eukprot:scaffold163228_cov21-Tisochrysis_lutea.AAC.1